MQRVLSLCVLALALSEVGAHALSQAHVPSKQDWRDAAAFVRGQLRDKDLITSAPGWTDPLLREAIGDRIDLAMAGRSDDSAYERVWSLSIRGAQPKELFGRTPELSRRFGEVTVERAELGPSPLLLDLARALPSAEVSVGGGADTHACSLGHFPPPRGGGLGAGVLPPQERFTCGRGTWVGAVVVEDLALQPRYCVRQPVVAGGPLRVRFADVPLGKRFVFYGGLYSEDERMRRGAPIDVRVLAGQRELLHMIHRDGDGWKRMEAATSGGRAAVTIEVRGRSTHRRGFCWAAETLTTGRGTRPARQAVAAPPSRAGRLAPSPLAAASFWGAW